VGGFIFNKIYFTNIDDPMLYTVQCESKKSPLRFSGFFPKRLGIFLSIFYTLITHYYLR